MTRAEADRISQVFFNVPHVTVTFDLVANTMEIIASGPNLYCMRSFSIDNPSVPAHIGGPMSVTMGNGTYAVPTGGTITINKTICTCGADKCGGLHSGWCDKKND